MTLAAWLDERRPIPPARLSARVRERMATKVEAQSYAEEFTTAGESLLRDLLLRPENGRESALDLLTVDALVTYAFEASADEPDCIETRALDAMRRLAAVAE